MVVFLTDPADRIVPEHAAALVTMAVGSKYEQAFVTAALPTFAAYATRHGYDVVVIQCPLDTSARAASRSIAWQKCLILSQPWSALYRRLVWVDADVIISPSAPSIIDACPEVMIGAVGGHDQYAPADVHRMVEMETGQQWEERGALLWRMSENRRIYLEDGHSVTFPEIIQTGVLVLTPSLHRDVLVSAYAHDSTHRWYEQTALSRGIQEAGLWHRISPRFNWLWNDVIKKYSCGGKTMERSVYYALVRGEFRVSYFLHFCHDQAWSLFVAEHASIMES